MVKIVLDAGHGGTDPGAVYEGRQEKDDNLQLVFDVGAVLENNGIEVEYTRVTDVYQSPYEKAAMANQSGADYFVSIHRNARDIPNTEGGVETLLYSTEDSVKRDMAEAINRNLEEIGFANRGVIARPNLVVLRDTDMPALLVEAGFLDSEADNALFDANQAAIADAIAYGILEGLQGVAGDKAVSEGMADNQTMSVGMTGEGTTVDKKVSEGAMGNEIKSEGTTGDKTKSEGVLGDKTMSEGIVEEPGMDVNNGGDGNNRYSENRTVKNENTMYRVQVGVYRNPSNARMMLNRLQIRGHQAYMIYRNGLYYVQAGAYKDLAEAVARDSALKRAGFSTVIVTE